MPALCPDSLEPRVCDAVANELLVVLRAQAPSGCTSCSSGTHREVHGLADVLGNPALDKLPTCVVVCLDFAAATCSKADKGQGAVVFLDCPTLDEVSG